MAIPRQGLDTHSEHHSCRMSLCRCSYRASLSAETHTFLHLQVVLVALAGVFWLCYLRLLLPLRDRLDLAIEVISSVADVFCFVGALVLTIVKTHHNVSSITFTSC